MRVYYYTLVVLVLVVVQYNTQERWVVSVSLVNEVETGHQCITKNDQWWIQSPPSLILIKCKISYYYYY